MSAKRILIPFVVTLCHLVPNTANSTPPADSSAEENDKKSTPLVDSSAEEVDKQQSTSTAGGTTEENDEQSTPPAGGTAEENDEQSTHPAGGTAEKNDEQIKDVEQSRGQLIVQVCIEDNNVDGECWRDLSRDPDEKYPTRAGDADYLLIKFVDPAGEPFSLGEAGFEKLTISADGIDDIERFIDPGKDIDKDDVYLSVPLTNIKKVGYLKKVQVRVRSGQPEYEGYFVHQKKRSWYAIGGKQTAIWFPIGLFSTNFQQTGSGIPFAAMPVGLAVGGRFFLAKDFYLGFSALGSWLVHPQIDENANATESRDGRFNLAAITLGGLVDLGNYVYLGYAYGFDFTQGGRDPGSMLVVGLGPGLLQLLKGR